MSSNQTSGPSPTSLTVVTGAAAGIGAAIAARLSSSGGPSLLCDLDEAALDRTREGLGVAAGAELLAGDVADPGFPERLIAEVAGRPIGAFVHCAAISASMASPARILEVNLAATLALVAALRPHMADGGTAILLSSSAGHYLGDALDAVIERAIRSGDVAGLVGRSPTPQRAYALSKRAVQLLVRREAPAFGAVGARIVSISPGLIDTPMGRAEVAAEPSIPGIIAGAALPRLGRPEEIAEAVAFLCSPAAGFITGCDLQVDGGQIAAFQTARALDGQAA